MRSAGRSSRAGSCASALRVAGSTVQTNRAANCTRAQHAQAVVARRSRGSTDSQQSALEDRAWPSNGSSSSPVSGSHAMALMVKSRAGAPRRDGSAPDRPSPRSARWPAPVFDSRRGSETSTSADLVDREALADGIDRAESIQQQRAGARPARRTPPRRCPCSGCPSEPVADPAADDQRPAAIVADCAPRCVRTTGGTSACHCSRRLPYFRTRRSLKPGASALRMVSPRDFACGYTSATGLRMQRTTAAATVSALCFGPSPLTEWP